MRLEASVQGKSAARRGDGPALCSGARLARHVSLPAAAMSETEEPAEEAASDRDLVDAIYSPTPPLFTSQQVDPWYDYRQVLVERCQKWEAGLGSRPDDLEGAIHAEVPQLFPPPAFSRRLAAGSQWRPGTGHMVNDVVITLGGVFGGFDGPSGLYEYIALVLSQVSFLQLDAGHCQSVASVVLRSALQWVLATYPGSHGRIVLIGFSMASAAIGSVVEQFQAALCGIVIISGQSAGTEGFAHLGQIPLLLVHGDKDLNTPAGCARAVATRAQGHGSDAVHLRFLRQDVDAIDEARRRMCLHHLWYERWDMQALVLEFVRQCHRHRVA